MTKIYRDDDGDLGLLQGKIVSILGYGNQGRAQALNMRDNGTRVVVGNVRDDSFDLAVADGFEAYEIPDAVGRADYHFLLVPDEVMPALFDSEIRPHLKPNQAIIVSSGYNITYDLLDCPSDVDVLMIAPRTIGTGVRSTFLNGTGFPSLVSVEHDASGQAQEVMLALAKSMGSLKRCAIESSCEEEALCDLFNEHSGGLYALRRAYDILVEAGVSPEAAMLEFWVSGEAADVSEAVQKHGLFGQLPLHSKTSQYGQQVTGRLSPEEQEVERRRLRKLIANIKNGAFAKDWTLEQQAGYPTLKRAYRENESHPMVQEEQRLLQLLGFWKGRLDK
jgi:ketol-acid reductoisomerase